MAEEKTTEQRFWAEVNFSPCSTRRTFTGASGVTIQKVVDGEVRCPIQGIYYSIHREPMAIYAMGQERPDSRTKPAVAGTIMFLEKQDIDEEFRINMYSTSDDGKQIMMNIDKVKLIEPHGDDKGTYLFVGYELTPWKELNDG